MNPVCEIIRRRLLQIGLPFALLWLVWQKLAARPIRPRLPDLVLFCALLSVNLASIFVGPLKLGYPRLITRLPPGRADERAIALTFDDGPHPETTPRLLDALRDHGARATFFVLAPHASRHPELVRRIVEEGHTLGLHGVRHAAVALWSVRQIEQEMRVGLHALSALPAQTHLYRPPYGFKSRTVQQAADHMGLELVNWSLNPKDYTDIDAAEITRRVLRAVRPGSIILLHDARSPTVEALPELLARLHGREYRCVRL